MAEEGGVEDAVVAVGTAVVVVGAAVVVVGAGLAVAGPPPWLDWPEFAGSPEPASGSMYC